MFELPPSTLGLVFDCDGTLADTMPQHVAAWVEAVRERGAEIPPALVYELAGMPAVRVAEVFNQRYGKNLPAESTARRKEDLFKQFIPQAKPIEPVVRIVRQYFGKLPMAVATGSPRDNCLKTLQTIGLENYFSVLVTADEVPNGKPAPDIYLEAARRLGVPADRCYAFDDGEMGLQSARAAGMVAINIHELK